MCAAALSSRRQYAIFGPGFHRWAARMPDLHTRIKNRRMTRKRLLYALLPCAFLAACASAPKVELARPEARWQQAFEHPVSHHQMAGDDLLIVGTTRHLYGLSPVTGERLWRLRNVNTNARDIIDLPDQPWLLVNDAAGGAFDDAGTHVLAVDRESGEIRWESAVLGGRILQARIDHGRHRLYAILVSGAHGDDRGLLSDLLPNKGLLSGFEGEPRLVGIDLDNGDVLWRRPFGQPVEMRPSVRPGVGGAGASEGLRPFDLGLYHPPVLAGELVCLTYAGMHCYRADDGTPVWSDEFKVVDGSLGLSYPNPILRDGRLIAGDVEQLYAFEPQTGRPLWRTEDIGRIPELLDDDVILYGQVGGSYFDLDDEEWVSRGPFEVVAVNRRNGNLLWRYHRIRRSISNLLVAGEFVYVADEEHLFALDRLDGSVGLREPHRLGEPPNILALNEAGALVLVSRSEAAGYDIGSGRLLWYERHEPPGPGGWSRFAAGLMSVTGGLLKLTSNLVAYGKGLLPPVPNITTGGRKIMSGRGLLEDSTGYLGEKLLEQGSAITEDQSFANLTGHTQYFVTRPEGHDVIALAAVNIESGATHELTVLPDSSPALVIDEVNGAAYQASGKVLVAIPLGRRIDALVNAAATDRER